MDQTLHSHLPPLIRDLGFLLLTGGLSALLFGFLRQPLTVGYLLAGFLIGPNFGFFPHLIEPDGIKLWGEIGVLFLLFGLGLEFSFKKLLEVGPSALVTASVEVIGMFAVGTGVAALLGFSQVESYFFGAMLAISSTAVLVRAIDDSGTRSARYAQNVFGILIVEDLYAILLLVLLATFSIAHDAAPVSASAIVIDTLLKFSMFLTVVFVVGVSVLPSLIRKTQSILSDEMRIVLSLGLCFMTVVVASQLGFSPTLGAFLMGSLLAGTREAVKIEALLLPVQQLFGAVFFISVGMQIQPGALIDNPLRCLVLLLVVLIGKPLLVTLGSLIAGKPVKPAVRSGVSMAQIGEFSFVIAALGTSLGVLSGGSSSLIVMIATITAFSTPFVVRNSKTISTWVDAKLPPRWKQAVDRYSASVQKTGGVSEWRLMIRRQLVIVFVNSTLIAAAGIFFEHTANEWLRNRLGTDFSGRVFSFLVALAITAPFFWGVVKGGVNRARLERDWVNPSLRPVMVFVMILRAVVFLALSGFLVSRFFALHTGVIVAGALVGGAVLLLSDRVERTYERFVQRFLFSLSDGDAVAQAEESTEKVLEQISSNLGPWDGHLAVFKVSHDSTLAGRTLRELAIRDHYGVSITLLERGRKKIPVPSSDERIYPMDLLHIVGNDEQLALFQDVAEVEESSPIDAAENAKYSLQSYAVTEESPLKGLSIRHSGIREKANGLIVGVERKGERILNPRADFKIDLDDLLWIVGDTDRLRELQADKVKTDGQS